MGVSPNEWEVTTISVNNLKASSLETLSKNKKISLLYGRFENLHAGHLRLIKFASEISEAVVVALIHTYSQEKLDDEIKLRIKKIAALGLVNCVITDCKGKLEQIVDLIKPKYFVRGLEAEPDVENANPCFKRNGTQEIFCSGSSYYLNTPKFSSEPHTELVEQVRNFVKDNKSINLDRLGELMHGLAELSSLVVGDLIVDEYIDCNVGGLSMEDGNPILIPKDASRFLGGAGIVAMHCASLGKRSALIGKVGNDELGRFVEEICLDHKVSPFLLNDTTRQTNRKIRYRVNGVNKARVSYISPTAYSREDETSLLKKLTDVLHGADCIFLMDYGYGVFGDQLARIIIKECRRQNKFILGDAQSSSQAGYIQGMAGVDLMAPTEHEARMACSDTLSSLPVLLNKFKTLMQVNDVLLTLGSDGVVFRDSSTGEVMEIPAFNKKPAQVSGAGDVMLTVAGMCRYLGGDQVHSYLLGSIASALHVHQHGNHPVNKRLMLTVLDLLH